MLLLAFEYIDLWGCIMRAALYIRVSTDDQTEYSPMAQKKAMLEYAHKNGYTVSKEHVYSDEGISGRKAKSRPAFMKMIKDAKTKKPFDVILVHKYDRFARSREDSVIYKSLLKKECGVKVISITEQIEDDKFSVILESMLEAMAEYYSLNLSDEVLKGMYERAQRGGYQARAPIGYKMKNKMLVIDDQKKDTIKYIFDAYNKGTNISDISDYLNKIGVTTNTGLPFKKRSIEYILRNPVYAGFISFNSKKKGSIIVPGIHEKIIDEKLFFSAKEKLLNDKHLLTRSLTQHKHFLSGFLYCSTCGSPLVYNNAKCPFFQCSQYKKGHCSSHYVTARSIERAVLDELINIFSYTTGPYESKSTGTSLYQNELLKAESALKRARTAYLNGIDTLIQYDANKTELTKKIKSLNTALLNINKPKHMHIGDLLRSENKKTLYIIINSIIEKIIYDKQTHTATILLTPIQ